MSKVRLARGSRLLVAVAAVAAATATVAFPLRAARAFVPAGHELIEAVAYRRLLALAEVPGAGVSGRALLAELIAGGVLAAPRCFDVDEPDGVCGPEARIETPLAFWPRLGSGAADMLVDRQLNARGQCQHFMAQTSDGLGPRDPRFGVPLDMVTTAYVRCTHVLGMVFEEILRDPRLASWRLIGMYALLHAVEDSFSTAHTSRDADGRIVYLYSWTLVDWPKYFSRGQFTFPSDVHHAVKDARDGAYLVPDAPAGDGRSCAEVISPYAVPESCLTAEAGAAVDAVVDLLVLTYRLRTAAVTRGRRASLADPESAEAWRGFMATHLGSAVAPVELQAPDRTPPRRPDFMLGVLGNIGHDRALGAGLWGGQLFLGPAVPFALALFGAAGFSRADGSDRLATGLELGLLLPLVRRFAIGVEPAGVELVCSTRFDRCTTRTFATLGQLIVPLGAATWLGAQGPRWSWDTRTLSGSWFGLALGWSHERVPRAHRDPAVGLETWDPPQTDEVASFRSAPATKLVYFAATAVSTADNQLVGVGLDVRRDRDRWDRRSGLAPGLGLELSHGVADGSRGGSVALIPTLRGYLVPSRVAVALCPALVRAGALGGRATAFDVGARLGLALDIGRVELEVDSPPLSYVSRDRWHTLPFSVRLGLLFD